jgi:ABC-2 type transport system permease protein
VLSPLAGLLPGSVGHHVQDYLPGNAGLMITRAHQEADNLLSPWQGFGVMCIWTAVLLGAATYALKRRDV